MNYIQIFFQILNDVCAALDGLRLVLWLRKMHQFLSEARKVLGVVVSIGRRVAVLRLLLLLLLLLNFILLGQLAHRIGFAELLATALAPYVLETKQLELIKLLLLCVHRGHRLLGLIWRNPTLDLIFLQNKKAVCSFVHREIATVGVGIGTREVVFVLVVDGVGVLGRRHLLEHLIRLSRLLVAADGLSIY